MTPEELKKLREELAKTFEDFKAENNKLHEQLKNAGAESATTKQNVETLNKRLDELQQKIKDGEKERDEIAARYDRLLAQGGKSGEDLQQLAAESTALFRAATGQRDLTVDAKGVTEYRNAFQQYLRRGDKAGAIANSMSIGSDPNGGYFVLPDTTGQVVTKIYETSPMRQVASVQTISSDALEGLVDNDEADFGWVGETQARPETNNPEVGKYRIAVHEMYAMPAATQSLLDDAAVNIEAWLAQKVADRLARAENAAFVNGNGSNKPRGFLDYTKNTTDDATRAWDAIQYIASGNASGFPAASGSTGPADRLFDLTYALKNAYRQNAVWMARRATYATIRKFKDTQGQYLWQPSLQAGSPATLMGYPVIEAEDMPAVAASAFPIAFGDFSRAYQIVDRVGLRVLRDPFTNKPYVRFYTTRRVGGGLINGEAVKLIRIEA